MIFATIRASCYIAKYGLINIWLETCAGVRGGGVSSFPRKSVILGAARVAVLTTSVSLTCAVISEGTVS